MPTHPIGSGTANISINVPIDERTLLGRLAFQAIQRGEARSAGDYQRQLIAKGLEAINPEAAARLREIRIRYYAGILAALIVASLCSSWFGGDSATARRSPSTVGIRRVVRNGRRELKEVLL
jgi:hypothetical protein